MLLLRLVKSEVPESQIFRLFPSCTLSHVNRLSFFLLFMWMLHLLNTEYVLKMKCSESRHVAHTVATLLHQEETL